MADNRVILSRQAAIAKGTIRYFTGEACKRGHIAERQLSNGSCIECRNADRRKFHKEKRERSLKWVKDWEARNSEWVYVRNKKWKEDNRDKVGVHGRNRRAMKMKADGTHTAADIAEILLMQGRRCAYCRVSIKKKKYHIDHIVALSKGGGNDRRNLQILCIPCNLSKHTSDPIDFMRSKGKLL